jgi:hypothetical protein
MFRATMFGLVILAFTQPALADEVTDTLDSAMQAYKDGDVSYAIEELDYAKQLLQAMKADELSGYLPEAPDGWTREISTDMSASLGMLGGGMGAEATYTSDNQEFTITIMANNPMVAAFGGMIANAGLMGGKLVRVGREKFLNDSGELTALVGGKVMVQASGAPVDVMVPVLKTIDYKKLSNFGS